MADEIVCNVVISFKIINIVVIVYEMVHNVVISYEIINIVVIAYEIVNNIISVVYQLQYDLWNY